MVIGTDLMKELGIQLDFSNDLIHMGTTQVSMTDIDALPSLRQSIRSYYGNRSHSSNARQGMRSQPKPGRPNLQRKTNKSASHADAQFSTGIEEPKSAAEAVERVSKILEAKYAPVTQCKRGRKNQKMAMSVTIARAGVRRNHHRNQ